jgi:hypothetical protein
MSRNGTSRIIAAVAAVCLAPAALSAQTKIVFNSFAPPKFVPGDQSRAMDKLGAVVVSGPAVRSYEIISKGIVQAFASQSFDSAYAFNVAQFAASVTEVPGGMGSAAFSVCC